MRQQPPCQSGQPVTVTVLGDGGGERRGEVTTLTGAALWLLLDEALPQGAPVKVQCDDALLLGEVFQCQAAAGRHAVGLILEHSLLHTAELARLAERLLENVSGAPGEHLRVWRKDASRLSPPATP